MLLAWKRVKANKGAAGMDNMSVGAFPGFARHHWERIRSALEQGTYRPAAVLRVMIPKVSGGQRPLGIPTVLDRVIQQAIAQVIGPLFEPHFSTHRYGFRPQPQLCATAQARPMAASPRAAMLLETVEATAYQAPPPAGPWHLEGRGETRIEEPQGVLADGREQYRPARPDEAVAMGSRCSEHAATVGRSPLSRASVLEMTAGTARCGPASRVVWEPGLALAVSHRSPDWRIRLSGPA